MLSQVIGRALRGIATVLGSLPLFLQSFLGFSPRHRTIRLPNNGGVLHPSRSPFSTAFAMSTGQVYLRTPRGYRRIRSAALADALLLREQARQLARVVPRIAALALLVTLLSFAHC